MVSATGSLLDALRARRALAIVRGTNRCAALRCIEVLVDEGLDLVEVSLTAEIAVGVIADAVARFGNATRIGAGTVRTPTQLDAALAAGATFVVTPGVGAGARAALERGVDCLPGVLTPTELEAGLEAGFDVLKLFPASLGGPAYLRALRDPYPDAPLVPVGGVGLDAVGDYLDAGALGVGIGGPLLGDAPRGGSLPALRERARALVSALGGDRR